MDKLQEFILSMWDGVNRTMWTEIRNQILKDMSLQARPITHVAVDGKTMYYLRVWNENENQFVLVNVRETVYKKLVTLNHGVDNIQEGGANALDNDSEKR